jgi:PAS domain S-box-containing protein
MKPFSAIIADIIQAPEKGIEAGISPKKGCGEQSLDDLFSQVIANAPIILFALDANGIINFCTGRAAEMTGLAVQDLIGQSVYDIREDISNADTVYSQLFSEDTGVASVNFRGYEFDVWHAPLFDEQDKAIGIAGVAIDVSQRSQAAEKLREERKLLQRVLQFHERDRQLIAYEIHDGFVQNATAAQMLLNSLLKSHCSTDSELSRQVQEASTLVQKAIDESRQLIRGLRPPVLEQMGVVAAISHLLDGISSNELTIQFKTDVEFKRLDPLLESTIYRIVQQAVNNIQRHSRADRAEIRLDQHGDDLHLEIQDWGIGFDFRNVSKDRFGLQGIRERARLMRGRVQIDSVLGKGTLIIIDLPLANPLE